MNLVNWKEYDVSIIERSFTSNYLVGTVDSTEYIKKFKEKMEIVKQYNNSAFLNDDKQIVCFAQFFPLYLKPVWVTIACDTVLKDTYFLCEYPADIVSVNHYRRSSTHCSKGFVSNADRCWTIIKQSAITRRPSPVELKGLQYHLSAWSYGQPSRSTVASGNQNNYRFCLKSSSFYFQRTKRFQETTNCSDAKQKYFLITQAPYRYSFMCNTNSQHICDQNTCILHAYVCDGIYDCFDKSDEANCSVPLTANSCAENVDSCEDHLLVYNGCADLYYECLTGECVPLAHRCDQHAHCRDNSDEVNCYIHEELYKKPSNFQTKVSFIICYVVICNSYGV